MRFSKISLFRTVLKRLKLHQFLNGVARIFPYTQAWVSEVGQEFENFSKKGCFFGFEWQTANYTTFAPPIEKRLEKSTSALLEKSFRRPCTEA